MKLIIVRHGETKENKAGIMQGQIQGTLTQKGIDQAKQVAKRLINEHVDFIYSSDLKRTVDTAKEIAKSHPKAQIKYTKVLREFSKGIYDGQPLEVVRQHRDQVVGPYYKYKWEKGESFEEVQERVVKFYHQITDQHLGKTVVIVSHGGAIASLLLYLSKKSYDKYHDFHPENCAITILTIDDDKNHQIQLLNCIQHLELEVVKS